ncbi:MAG: ATP-binding protein [Phenylobacterium sp.]|uniref:sensor histidine kinase n=1 Tax=Phenylobacterium sp. TaxID=1871053 RepID=UPI003918D48C
MAEERVGRPEGGATTPGGAGAPGERVLSQVLAALLIVLSASGVAVWLFHGLHVHQIIIVFLAAVLLSAVLYGMVIGMFSALLAAAAFRFFIGDEALSAQITSWGDAALVGLFMGGVWAAGVYTDRLTALSLAADEGEAPDRSLTAWSRSLGGALARARGVDEAAQPLRREGPRALAALIVIGVGAYIGQLMLESMGAAAPALLLLCAVVAVATTLGARFGLAAGILGVAALNAVMTAGPQLAHASLPVLLFEFAVFAGVGWWVGREADRLEGERRALEIMVRAGRDLAATTDEGHVRQALFDALAGINPHGSVRLADEGGAVTHEALRSGGAGPSPSWRTRRLAADGRDVGTVYWTGPKGHAMRDDVISALVDIGASTIVRTRLGVEKADMEFVARTEQLRTILLDAVSHQFRTPLAGIIGSVTSILNLPEPHDRAARRDLLLIIKEQSNRLHRYVENFLAVARLESGSIHPKFEDVVVEPLIYDVWETFGEAGGARRFLHVKIDQAPVRTDASLLSQIFGNVLENAIKFSPEGSVVEVRSRIEGDRIVFDIADQGCGIPADAAPRIFERFYRSRGAIAPGLGLGLYIVRSLAEKLGGSVEARNRADAGSGLVVSIALPLARAA